MRKLESLIEFIRNFDYTLTSSSLAITQKERNELKYNLTEAIVDVLKENGLENITRTTDGYILELPHDEFGAIFVELNLKVKNFDFDILAAEEDWKLKIQQRKNKEEALAKKANKKKSKKVSIPELE
jgi:hypothetical protein